MNNLNLKETYFGFTDNLKPLQAGKIKKSLNMTFRFPDGVMTQKEHIYKRLQEGYKLEIEENYSYYSPRLNDYTKPKTLYKLVAPDETFFELNKTLYKYAQYILENDFTNIEKAIAYIQQEKANKEAQARLQREQEEKERQQWRRQGKKLLESLSYNPITEVFNSHWQEIESIYKERGQVLDKEAEYKDCMNKIIEILGNKNYCTYWVKTFVEYENSQDYNFISLEKNPVKFLEKEILFKVFNITKEDQPRTITNKINSVYNNIKHKSESVAI